MLLTTTTPAAQPAPQAGTQTDAARQDPASWKEMMACFLARQIRDTDRICSGAHTEISFAATMLAQKMHAPNLRLQLGGGAFLCNVADREIDELPRTSVDYRIMNWAEAYFEHHDTFNHYGPPGGRDYYENTDRWRSTNKYFFADKFFVGGIQVDRHGNVNLIGVGDKDGFRFRGPGSVGINDVTTVRDVFVFMTAHDRQRLVEKADFVSMPGPRTYREKDLAGNGPQFIVTPRCVFDFSGPGSTAALAGLFPGHTEEEVADNTGWEITKSPQFAVHDPPSRAELDILRNAVDRKGVLRK
jgi:glutaconate CoA-transferase, subunit B